MIGFVIGTIATAIALIIMTAIIPQITITDDYAQLLVVAAIVGVVNGLIGPIVKTLALPISFVTLGLAGLLINAGLLLGVAWLAGEVLDIPFSIAGFPPDFSIEAVVWAAVGALVLSVITTVIAMVTPGRR
jgi:putative membrane protein